MKQYLENGVLVEKTVYGENYLVLTVHSENLIHFDGQPQAGQFYMLAVPDERKILKRPISLAHYDKVAGTLVFVVKNMGEGTELLFSLEKGDALQVQGPLGHGFSVAKAGEQVMLVGGGVGIAPLRQLLLESLSNGADVTLVAGAREYDELYANLAHFEREALEKIKLLKYTDKPSEKSETGNVVDGMTKSVSEHGRPDRVYSCGPTPMLRGVKAFCDAQEIPAELSLEARMGCGVGACVCCSIKTEDGMKKVCRDGPVFVKEKVIFA